MLIPRTQIVISDYLLIHNMLVKTNLRSRFDGSFSRLSTAILDDEKFGYIHALFDFRVLRHAVWRQISQVTMTFGVGFTLEYSSDGFDQRNV